MTLANIALHLEQQSLGTRGTDIFIDMMGAELSTGITLRQWGGNWDENYNGLIREAVFQAVIRGAHYAAAQEKMEAVLPALTIRQRTIGTAYYYFVHPMQDPIPFGREAAGVTTFVVNCITKYRLI